MKILVISDTHGSYEALLDSIIYEEFDMIIHLGDYVEDGEAICEYLSPSFPRNHFYHDNERKPSYGIVTIGHEIKSEIIEV